MIDLGPRNVLGVMVDAVDLEGAADRVIQAAQQGRGLGVSALAVHGLMLGSRDAELRYRLNNLGMCVPDGQPVRWALNLLYGTRLEEKVPGPDLMLELCRRASETGLPIYLYGSAPATLDKLRERLQERFPLLQVAGWQPSRFRAATPDERAEDLARIRASGARMVFVGLGCPRQEVWAFENAAELGMPSLAVGAAFDYLANNLQRAPRWMQRAGLEWLHRLSAEPRRLWRRYLLLNPAFIKGIALQLIAGRAPEGGIPPRQAVRPG